MASTSYQKATGCSSNSLRQPLNPEGTTSIDDYQHQRGSVASVRGHREVSPGGRIAPASAGSYQYRQQQPQQPQSQHQKPLTAAVELNSPDLILPATAAAQVAAQAAAAAASKGMVNWLPNDEFLPSVL